MKRNIIIVAVFVMLFTAGIIISAQVETNENLYIIKNKTEYGYLYGFINKSGKIVIEPEFDDVKVFSEGLSGAKYIDKWGFINKNGDFAIDFIYDDVSNFSEGIALVFVKDYENPNEGRYGYINREGEYIIRPIFEDGGDFVGGIAPVKINGKWAYIDKNLNFITKPKYDGAESFYMPDYINRYFNMSYTKAKDKKESKTGKDIYNKNVPEDTIEETDTVIERSDDDYDTEGKSLEELINEIEDSKSEDRSKIHNKLEDGENKQDNELSNENELKNKYNKWLNETRAAVVKIGEKYGYIDNKGNILIEAKYDTARNFSEDYAVVGIEDDLHSGYYEYAYIDKKGDFISEERYEDAYPFSEGLACVMINGKYGYIDTNGDIAIQPKYEACSNFNEGFASVMLKSKYGYIDTSGNILPIEGKLDYHYDLAFPFHNGLALVITGSYRFGIWYYIDTSGNIVY